MTHQDGAGMAVAAAAFLLAAAVLVVEGVGGASRLSERTALARASGMALETSPVGQAMEWHDAESGVVAVITPALAFRDASGRWCRPFELDLAKDATGPMARSRHVSCRDERGGWTEQAAPARSVTQLDRWLDRLIGPQEQIAERRG